MSAPFLRTFTLRNFKAVRDSSVVRFTPLTALIGNNGSGKSSLIEGLETLKVIVEDDLDRAMERWAGFEQVIHRASSQQNRQGRSTRPRQYQAMHFGLSGMVEAGAFSASLDLNAEPGANTIFIQHEQVVIRNTLKLERDAEGQASLTQLGTLVDMPKFADGRSALDRGLGGYIEEWQFVSFAPQIMGSPAAQKRTGGRIRLESDGSNIAEYLLSIRTLDPIAFEGIVEALQFVAPYVRDLQPTITSELGRSVYLQLTEGDFKIPGWLLSTGTLRIVALLALLRHPSPPPLIVIEEIENGLDPRTLSLLVDELRAAVESGATQVIFTTHSPYLLDLLSLDHIIVVERVDGQPTFTRPADRASLQTWTERFGPGRLYTMGKLDLASAE